MVTLQLSAERRNHCGTGKGELSMLSNGDLYPCQLSCKPQYLAGNIFDQSSADIFYSSEVLKKLRDLTVDQLPGCFTCDVKHICGDGCRAIALEMHGNIQAHNDYFCNFLHRLAVDGMWRDSLICQQAGKPIGHWLWDIGSDLNYRRKNFLEMMAMVERGKLSEIVIAHRDRLVRFGYEWFEHLRSSTRS